MAVNTHATEQPSHHIHFKWPARYTHSATLERGERNEAICCYVFVLFEQLNVHMFVCRVFFVFLLNALTHCKYKK